MRYNLIMAAQGLSSELGEQVVLEVAGEGPDYRGGGEVLRAGSLGRWVGWVRRWRKDHPESVDAEASSERSAQNRRLRAWLREARMEIELREKRLPSFAQRVPVGVRYALRPPR